MKLNREITISGTEPLSKTPQVNQLIVAIKAIKKHKFTEEELRKHLEAGKFLTTKQDKFLIFQYYRKELQPWLSIAGAKSSRVVKSAEQIQAEYNQLMGK